MLFGLVLLLVGSKQDVVWLGTAEDGTLGAHRMGFTSQRAGAEGTVGQLDTALLFDVDGSCL